MDSIHTLKMKLTGFPDELDVGCEDKEDYKFCCLQAGRMEAPFSGTGMIIG